MGTARKHEAIATHIAVDPWPSIYDTWLIRPNANI